MVTAETLFWVFDPSSKTLTVRGPTLRVSAWEEGTRETGTGPRVGMVIERVGNGVSWVR